MRRHVSAIILVLCLTPAAVHAQGVHLTVTAASAEVRKAPSVANPVIGHARRGTVLEVTREVGDWVKVSWPEAADGVGYVRASAGSVNRGGTASASRVSATSTGSRGHSRSSARCGEPGSKDRSLV